MSSMAELPDRDVILIPVHNRVATTLAALRALAEDKVFDWSTVVVIDDGSTDGTHEQVARAFPEVQVLTGDGSWWWGGAIRRGMAWALARGATRIFWLNDDCHPPRDGLLALRDHVQRTGAVSWIEARTPRGWSYGAHRKGRWSIRRCTPEEEANGEIDTFSGNCVCLPRSWIERVGLPDDQAFPHGFADLDYGLRLKRAGAELRAVPEVVAASSEPANAASERWLTTPRSMRRIWSEFSSPRSFLYFPAWRRFAWRHWGLWHGSVVFALPYVRWAVIALGRALAPSWTRAWAARRDLTSASGRGPTPG